MKFPLNFNNIGVVMYRSGYVKELLYVICILCRFLLVISSFICKALYNNNIYRIRNQQIQSNGMLYPIQDYIICSQSSHIQEMMMSYDSIGRITAHYKKYCLTIIALYFLNCFMIIALFRDCPVENCTGPF